MDGIDKITAADLSAGFAEVAAIVGIAAARSLVRGYAGQRLGVPMAPTDELNTLIGAPAAQLLCTELGGLRIVVPSEGSIARIIRRREIIDLRGLGLPVKTIARQVHLTERAVWYVLKSDEAPDE